MASLDYAALAGQYRNALLDDIVPFWQKHSLDEEYGGYLHCLDRDGKPFADEKMMWMQCREVWMFSHLYRIVEKKGEWLDAAKLGAEFLRDHGHDENMDWYFLLARDGTPVVAPYNIFSELFAVAAFAEYGAVSGEGWATDLAVKTFRRILKRMENPKGKWNKKLPGAQALVDHAFPMMMTVTAGLMREFLGGTEYDAIIEENLNIVMGTVLDKERKIVFEFANPDGTHPDSPDGRLINSGHVIESMWFMMDELERRGDKERIKLAAEVMLNAFEVGWDKEHGGFFAFIDSEGYSPTQLEWHMKLWWSHCEGLYGCLRAFELTGDDRFLEWFRKIHDYTWKRFPDPEYGEWFGYLDRQGNVTHRYKGSRWKGFFHIPRGLLYCWKKLEKLHEETK